MSKELSDGINGILSLLDALKKQGVNVSGLSIRQAQAKLEPIEASISKTQKQIQVLMAKEKLELKKREDTQVKAIRDTVNKLPSYKSAFQAMSESVLATGSGKRQAKNNVILVDGLIDHLVKVLGSATSTDHCLTCNKKLQKVGQFGKWQHVKQGKCNKPIAKAGQLSLPEIRESIVKGDPAARVIEAIDIESDGKKQ